MHQVIYKYEVEVKDEPTRLLLPFDSRLLFTDVQAGKVMLWVQHDDDPENKKINRTFKIYGTGHKHLDMPQAYIGTAHCKNSGCLWHVYELYYETPEVM